MARGKRQKHDAGLASASPASQREIRIRLASERMTPSVTVRLREAFAAHPGPMPLKLLVGDEVYGGVSVDGSEELRSKVKRILDGPTALHESRYAHLDVFGALVVGELDYLEEAVAYELVRRWQRDRQEVVTLGELWQALYDHWRDRKTGDVYTREGERWLRLERDEYLSVELPPEVVRDRLERISATSPHRSRITLPEGTPPPKPDFFRRKVILGLRSKQLPVVSSTDPSVAGFRLACSRAEMEADQASHRQKLATELARLDQQIEVAERLEHYLETGELLEVEVPEEAPRGPNSYRAERQANLAARVRPGPESRESKRVQARGGAATGAGPSWDQLLGGQA